MDIYVYKGESTTLLTKNKTYRSMGFDSNPLRDGKDYIFIKNDLGEGFWVSKDNFVPACGV